MEQANKSKQRILLNYQSGPFENFDIIPSESEHSVTPIYHTKDLKITD